MTNKMSALYFVSWFAILSNQVMFSNASPFIGTESTIQQAGEHEFDFIVSISIKNFENLPDKEDNHICGGSLITTKHVLTAAHCRCDGLAELEDYTVEVGHDLRNWEANFSVASWKTYKKCFCDLFKRGYKENDISVIKLTEDIHTKITREIVLPTLIYLPINQLYGKTAVTAGWGIVNTLLHPRYMQKVTLTTISLEECQKNIDDAPKVTRLNGKFRTRYILENNTLCSNGNQVPGLAPYTILGEGDSGGPLLIERNQIIAINQASIPGEGPDNIGYEQNLHMTLLPYRKFIEKQIKSTEWLSPAEKK